MNTAVVLRQVPDLIEALEVAGDGAALDYGAARFIVNEWDNHALEQALLLKESTGALGGGIVAVVTLDFGDVDNTLYEAAAKGADQIIKVPWDQETPPSGRQAAAMYAEVLKGLKPDLILMGCQAHDELEGAVAPRVAQAMGLPYVGVIRGLRATDGGGCLQAFKEFPGAVMARMSVRLPAVIGILAAEQAPRYVPVSRIRAAMKSARFAEQEAPVPAAPPAVRVSRLYPPAVGTRAEMLGGSAEEVAARIVEILAEKGLVQ